MTLGELYGQTEPGNAEGTCYICGMHTKHGWAEPPSGKFTDFSGCYERSVDVVLGGDGGNSRGGRLMGRERLTTRTAGGNMAVSRSGQVPCVLLSVVDCTQTTTRHICGLSNDAWSPDRDMLDAGAACCSGGL
jgi:hypothetical protein